MQKIVKTICFAILIYSSSVGLKSQCTITSTDGYTVSITVKPESIIKPNNCMWGYNYNLRLKYEVVFSGNNIPSSLSVLQGNITCGTDNHFYNLLPLDSLKGDTITGSNVWRGISDCDTITLSGLFCNNYTVNIQGPGIEYTTLNCNVVLPVKLINFSGNYLKNDNTVSLKWETASEENSSHFEVLRSVDGTNFNKIGQIKSHTNSKINNSYEFIDNQFSDAITYYYQLKMVNLDNTYNMSEILSIQTSAQGINQVIVSPNPAKNGIFNVFISSELNTHSGNIEVYNQNMQLILEQNIMNTRVDLSNFTNGIYFLKVGSYTTKMVKMD